jgi:prepilin-type N-terminal cleavage/methylation domain-containing protein
MKETPELSMKSFSSYKGFTLIELMISMTIIVLLSVTLLANFPSSVVRLNLINVVHAAALLLREAQIKGSAVQSLNASVSGYGVRFNLANPDKILLYGDLAGTYVNNGISYGNIKYDTAPIDEVKSTTILPANYRISKVCTGTAFPFNCDPTTFTELSIAFIRPSPQPIIFVNNLTSPLFAGACIEFVYTLKAPDAGYVRSVRVLGAGLISASNQPCK